MSATERVINDLNVAKLILCNPQVLTPEMCVKIGQAINSAIDLLTEQKVRTTDMTEDEIKALCKIRDKYCQWGEVAVMDKAIRLIQDQQNEIRLLKEM